MSYILYRYNIITEQSRGQHTWVYTAAEQLQEVETKTTYKCAVCLFFLLFIIILISIDNNAI